MFLSQDGWSPATSLLSGSPCTLTISLQLMNFLLFHFRTAIRPGPDIRALTRAGNVGDSSHFRCSSHTSLRMQATGKRITQAVRRVGLRRRRENTWHSRRNLPGTHRYLWIVYTLSIHTVWAGLLRRVGLHEIGKRRPGPLPLDKRSWRRTWRNPEIRQDLCNA